MYSYCYSLSIILLVSKSMCMYLFVYSSVMIMAYDVVRPVVDDLLLFIARLQWMHLCVLYANTYKAACIFAPYRSDAHAWKICFFVTAEYEKYEVLKLFSSTVNPSKNLEWKYGSFTHYYNSKHFMQATLVRYLYVLYNNWLGRC